jgi:DNA (cytosine-5)-methyltransferase 1
MAEITVLQGDGLSIFSGCGGFDRGFIDAGGRLLGAYDFNPDACRNYERVMMPGHHVEQADLSPGQFDYKTLPHAELIFGGPPCQDFSEAGRGAGADGERNLWPATIEIIKVKRPNYFLFENVPAFQNQHPEYFAQVAREFEALDYKVTWKILNAADFGVPQTRRRIFIAGRKWGCKPWLWPEPTHQARPVKTLFGELKRWVSWSEALAGWLEIPRKQVEFPNWIKEWYPGRGVPDGYFNGQNAWSNGTRIHRRPNEPAYTITASEHGRSRIKLGDNVIMVDLEAYCILQGLPTMVDRREQIGNAVPPLMARAIFEANL